MLHNHMRTPRQETFDEDIPSVHGRVLWVRVSTNILIPGDKGRIGSKEASNQTVDLWWPALRYRSISALFADLPDATHSKLKAKILLSSRQFNFAQDRDNVAFFLGREGAPFSRDGSTVFSRDGSDCSEFIEKIPASGEHGSKTMSFYDGYEKCQNQFKTNEDLRHCRDLETRFDEALADTMKQLNGGKSPDSDAVSDFIEWISDCCGGTQR